jgi:hypothetical protein
MTDDREAEFAWGRLPGRVYLSKRVLFGESTHRDATVEDAVHAAGPVRVGDHARFAYEVIVPDDEISFQHEDGREVVLRVTEKARQQLKALFFEDDRAIERLVFQRFTASGKPISGTVFSLSGEAIHHLREFLDLIAVTPIPGGQGIRLDSDIVKELLKSPEASAEVYAANPDEVFSLIQADINAHDVIAIARRRKSLEQFERLLDDRDFFETTKKQSSKSRDEDVWQEFFDQNRWIFGFGLAAQLLIGWDEAKFEAVIEGTTAWGHGKRTDAHMRTAGVLSSLCFVEIKLPTAPLLAKDYRTEAWVPAKDLAGGVAQLHTTLDKAMKKSGMLQAVDEKGFPVGQPAYLCRPRSYLLIGRHDGFLAADGRVNESMYRSFENYRRALKDPEVLTYDELLFRARHLLHMAEEGSSSGESARGRQGPTNESW